MRNPRTIIALWISACAVVLLAGACGGGSGGFALQQQTTATVTSVTVSPSKATIQEDGTEQFTASVKGTGNYSKAVTWSATGGTITSTGLYTAPATTGTYMVTAKSASDSTKSASATVTVTANAQPAISLSPASFNFSTTQGGANPASQALTITNSGASGSTLNYLVSHTQAWLSLGGSLSGSLAAGQSAVVNLAVNISGLATGTYGDAITVSAGGAANSPQTAIVSLSVGQAIAVSVSPPSATLQVNGMQQFTATVTGTTNTAVTWSATGGTITQTGLYTAPATAGTYIVTATSQADTTKSASASVTVTAAPQPTISLSPSSFTFSATQGGSNPSSQTLTITNSGPSGSTLDYTVSKTQSWLSLGGNLSGSLAPGQSASVSLSISISGLTAGTYNDGVAVAASGASNTPQTASVSLTVGQAIAVSISPTSATVQTSGTQQFTASVTGTSNTAVTWSASCGTVTQTGLYTAPGTTGTCTVTATSQADTTKSTSATVTVTAPISVSISPTSATVQTSGTQQFTASVTGTSNTAVTWSATCGTITQTGLYTAPGATGTCTVTATSQADTTKLATATVTVTAPVIVVSLSPTSVTLQVNGTQQFTTTVTGTTNTAVTWSATGGTISSSGLYTAPATIGTYTVKATSQADTTKSASATVTVTAPAQPAISLSPASFSFSATQGGSNPGSQTLTITNSGPSGSTLDYTVSKTQSWLSLGGNLSGSLAPGQSASVSLSVNISGLSAGTFSDTVTVSGSGASNTPQTASVSLTVAQGQPTIALSPTSFTFSATQGGSNPANQLLTLTNSGSSGSTLNYTVSKAQVQDWLTLIGSSSGSLNSGQSTSFALSVNISGLAAGTYSETITVSASGATNTPQTVPVTLTINPGVAVSVSPASVSLQPNDTQQFTASVTGTTNTAVTWSATGGTITQTGLYTAPATTGTYTVTATSQADSTKSATATVTVTTAPQPTISLSPASFTFSATQGGSNPANQLLTLANSGASGSTLNYTVSKAQAQDWLTLIGNLSGSLSSGQSASFALSVNISGLAAGTYSETITVSASGATNTPQTVPVTLTISPGIAVSVSPTSATVLQGGTQQFTASVTGTTNTGVTWSADCGTIDQSGLYTAPSTTVQLTCTVRATSQADTTKFATATVTVQVIAVSISPTSATVQPGGTQQFTATVTGTTNTAVTWSATGGTIDQTGLYTAPATSGTYTVKAASQADSTKFASATVTVPAPTITLVTVSPTTVSVVGGEAQQFTSTVQGTGNFDQSVTWYVDNIAGGNATVGTIDSTGLYVAPLGAGSHTVKDVSVANDTKFATASVTVTLPPPQLDSMDPAKVYAPLDGYMYILTFHGAGFEAGGTLYTDGAPLVLTSSSVSPDGTTIAVTEAFDTPHSASRQMAFYYQAPDGTTTQKVYFDFLGNTGNSVVDSQYVYYVDRSTGTVSRFNLSDLSLAGTFKVGTTDGLAFDSKTGLTLTISYVLSGVTAWHTADFTQKFSAGLNSRPLSVAAFDGYGCVAQPTGGLLTSLDLSAINLNPISTTLAGNPWVVAMGSVSGVGDVCASLDITSGKLTIVTIPGMTIQAQANIGVFTKVDQTNVLNGYQTDGGWWLAVLGQNLFLVNRLDDVAMVFDLKTAALKTTVDLSQEPGTPFRVTPDPANNRVDVVFAVNSSTDGTFYEKGIDAGGGITALGSFSDPSHLPSGLVVTPGGTLTGCGTYVDTSIDAYADKCVQ